MADDITTSTDDTDATVEDDDLTVAIDDPSLTADTGSTTIATELSDSQLEALVSDTITVQGLVETKNAVGEPVTDSTTSVSSGNSTTLVSYTASNRTAFMGVTANGTSDGKYVIETNGNRVTTLYANHGEPNAQEIFASSIELQDGDNVTVTVENVGQQPGDYDGTIYVSET